MSCSIYSRSLCMWNAVAAKWLWRSSCSWGVFKKVWRNPESKRTSKLVSNRRREIRNSVLSTPSRKPIQLCLHIDNYHTESFVFKFNLTSFATQRRITILGHAYIQRSIRFAMWEQLHNSQTYAFQIDFCAVEIWHVYVDIQCGTCKFLAFIEAIVGSHCNCWISLLDVVHFGFQIWLFVGWQML